MKELFETIHPQWLPLIEKSIKTMDENYLASLESQQDWLPGPKNLFAAFRQPLQDLRYLLLGESPYPRALSANGFAFWDAKVQGLWSKTGLSKEVNRATSLRNFIKMLLLARGDLQNNFSQEAIAALEKSAYCQTAAEFFSSLIEKGFLLLNASLVYSEGKVLAHAKLWRPFLSSLLTQLHEKKAPLQLILFGRIAAQLPEAKYFPCLSAEHPYNLSFITNQDLLDFFKPLDLLAAHPHEHLSR